MRCGGPTVSVCLAATWPKIVRDLRQVRMLKNPTEGEVGEVQRASRHDLVRALAPGYGHLSKSEKGQILGLLCEMTGYTRKYALTLLKDPPPDTPSIKRKRRRLPSYGPAEVELLRRVGW